MKIGIIQANFLNSNFEVNKELILSYIEQAFNLKLDLVIFPEFTLNGFFPFDILYFKDFFEKLEQNLFEIVDYTKNFNKLKIIIGTLIKSENKIYNSSILINDGEIKKIFLKNYIGKNIFFNDYDYFDDFNNNVSIKIFGKEFIIDRNDIGFNIENYNVGVLLSSDALNFMDENKFLIYDIILNISVSPFCYYKEAQIKNYLLKNENKIKNIYITTNFVGNNDELIFEGGSFLYNKNDKNIYFSPYFKEGITLFEIENNYIKFSSFYDYYSYKEKNDYINNNKDINQDIKNIEQIKKINIYELDDLNRGLDLNENKLKNTLNALIFGLRDYVKKSGFSKVCLGLSGGIDSAVVAYIARETFGPQNVYAFTMPSPFSSKGSYEDSYKLAGNLGISIEKVDISALYETYINSLSPYFEGKPFDITEENLQARIRANILMAFSNKFNYFLLNTSNKSEIATGYGTLYGDSTGGFSILGDIYKTIVYKLAFLINKEKEIIPESIIKKAPSAELKPGQKDQDVLPPYDLLDNILYFYIEENYSPLEIIKKGFDEKIVIDVIRRVNKNEYKRKQLPLVLKVSKKSYSRERRFPVNVTFDNLFFNK